MIEIKRDAVNHDMKDFRGSAEDDKPTDCSEGSTFYEYDSGNFYMYSGEEWLMQSSGGGGGGAAKSAMGYLCSGGGSADMNICAMVNQPNYGATYPAFYTTTAMDGDFPDISTQVFAAGSGDTFYLTLTGLPEGSTLEGVTCDYYDAAHDTGGALLEILASDFEEGSDCIYTEATIPEVDLNGDDWVPGASVLITFTAYTSGGDEPPME